MPETDFPDPPAPSSSRELAILVAAGLVVVAGAVGWMRWQAGQLRPPLATSLATQYVGEPTCRECHPGETARYHGSGHALTLQPAAERVELVRWLNGRSASDPEYPGATFTYSRQATDGRLTVERRGLDSPEVSLPIEYAFGSGHHATTFVTLTDPDNPRAAGLEHRMTYFASDERLGITPGQEVASDVDPKLKSPTGRTLTSAQALKCFDCHTTRLSDRDQKHLDPASMIANVSCERCHGPARRHVEAARRGETKLKMPFGAGRYSTAQQMELCGHCHRLPDMAPPGAIRPDNPDLARFQPVGLMVSKCYKNSNGALNCATCHDPHARASTDARTYEAACLSCHRAAPRVVCKVSPASGCVGCHMPKRDAGQKILFADHWIRVHPEAATPLPPANH